MLVGHTDVVYCVAFCPDGRRLATGSRDHVIKLWDTATGHELRAIRAHTENAQTARSQRWKLPSFGADEQVRSVTFSPAGDQLASTGGRDGSIVFWDTATGQELRAFTKHSYRVASVAFSPDGRHAASASDKTIKFWDTTTGVELRTLTGHSSSIDSVAFSPDGTRLASGGKNESYEGNVTHVPLAAEIKVWNVANGQELSTLEGHTGRVESLAFSPVGDQLVSADSYGAIKLWDAGTGQGQRTIIGKGSCVHGFALSPDGALVASAGCDKTIKVWDVATGQELRTMSGHGGPIYSLAFSPDGTRLASASGDATVKLWDTATGQELGTLKGHSETVRTVTFSSDGCRVASGSDDGTILLWDGRPLTPEVYIEREALSVMWFLFDYKKLSKAKAIDHIQADQTITEQVRQKAIAFAGTCRRELEIRSETNENRQ